jgi:hypothetical protein
MTRARDSYLSLSDSRNMKNVTIGGTVFHQYPLCYVRALIAWEILYVLAYVLPCGHSFSAGTLSGNPVLPC